MSKTGEDVLDAIVEREVEAEMLVDRVTGRLDVTKTALRKLTRRVYLLRMAGKLTKSEARKLFVREYAKLAVREYAHDIAEVKRITDESLEREYSAIEKLTAAGRRLSSLPILKTSAIRERLEERRAEVKGDAA
jgi:hypothetical protein